MPTSTTRLNNQHRHSIRARHTTYLLLVLLAGIFGAVPINADVLDDIAGRAGFTGSFEQQVFDTSNVLLATSQGEFAVLRPSAFRWEVQAPDQQLLIINEGVLWQYDRDLETVIRRPAPDGEASPLQLLTADRNALEARYQIAPVEEGLELTPLQRNDLFQRLVIAAPAPQRLSLTITDALEQRIVIQLALDGEPSPSPALFEFEPPEGVEWLEGKPGPLDPAQ